MERRPEHANAPGIDLEAADRLLQDLELIDWPEPIKSMQRNWIGRSLSILCGR